MRKFITTLLFVFFLSACDSHLVNLDEVASQINRHIDYSQRDKMAYFLEKAEADPYNNAIILYHSSNLPVNQKEFMVFKAMQINGYCRNPEVGKELLSKGVKFILILKDNSGMEFNRLEISEDMCKKI